MTRRTQGRLRKMTQEERSTKATRNERRGRPIFVQIKKYDRKGNVSIVRVPKTEDL